MQTLRLLLLACLAGPLCLLGRAQASQASPEDMVRDAVKFQVAAYQNHPWGLQYRVHRVDSKEDSIREVIETPDGNVSRTLTYKGRALTPEEQQGERERLQALTPEDVRKRRDKSGSIDNYALDLIGAMPEAMLYTPAEGQPQLPREDRPQTVLDFVPNPKFRPATTTQSLLSGIAGRIWLDAETHHLSRIEVRVTKDLNLMFGILARVYEGGTLSYEQRPVAPGIYCYSQTAVDIKLRELMLHTAPYKQTTTVTEARFLPAAPSVKRAVEMLLAIPPVTP